ncbi:MAG: hypothetical protein KF861_18930 [Planctomycetaceae bacterium]|nr:hypothetical protein [Planctomycetaceae bacterium]
MYRLTTSTCSVLAEVAAVDAASPGLALGLCGLGLAVATAAWWNDFRRLVDGIVGLDL